MFDELLMNKRYFDKQKNLKQRQQQFPPAPPRAQDLIDPAVANDDPSEADVSAAEYCAKKDIGYGCVRAHRPPCAYEPLMIRGGGSQIVDDGRSTSSSTSSSAASRRPSGTAIQRLFQDHLEHIEKDPLIIRNIQVYYGILSGHLQDALDDVLAYVKARKHD